MTQPQGQEPTTDTTVEPPAEQAADLPWSSDEEFDPEKAKKLILGLRADKERLSARKTLTPEQEQQLAAYKALEEASKSELERAQEQATAIQQERDQWRQTAVTARIEALAATEFADPSDAAAALNAAEYVDVGGVVDEPRIKADLAALLERKPHWRRTPGSGEPAPRVPAPNPAQGSGNGPVATDPGAIFGAILKGMNK